MVPERRNCLDWLEGNDGKNAPGRDHAQNFRLSAGRPAGNVAGPRPAWRLQSQNVSNTLRQQSY